MTEIVCKSMFIAGVNGGLRAKYHIRNWMQVQWRILWGCESVIITADSIIFTCIGQDASQEFQHNGPRTVAQSFFIRSLTLLPSNSSGSIQMDCDGSGSTPASERKESPPCDPDIESNLRGPLILEVGPGGRLARSQNQTGD